jgi:hypothetical protein
VAAGEAERDPVGASPLRPDRIFSPIGPEHLGLLPLFTGVRGRQILRSSQARSSKKFAGNNLRSGIDSLPIHRLS